MKPQKEVQLTQEQKEDLVHGEVQLFQEITSKVFVGQMFPNYKALCLTMGEVPQTNTNSKEAQLRSWSMYFRWSKKGHRLTIEEVFGKPSSDNLFRSNEQHIKDSYSLLGTYLLDNLDTCTQSTKYDTVYTAIIFNKDIALHCGFLPETFYNDTLTKLSLGKFTGKQSLHHYLQTYLADTLKSTFRDTADGIVASLAKKSSLNITKVLVAYKNKERFILDSEDYVRYKEAESLWVTKHHAGNYFMYLKARKSSAFREFLAEKGLNYESFYTGYALTFSVVSLKQDMIKEALKREANNLHFVGKVKKTITKDRKADIGTYNRNLLNKESLAKIDWLLEEFLTYGFVSAEDKQANKLTNGVLDTVSSNYNMTDDELYIYWRDYCLTTNNEELINNPFGDLR